jgi:hypothetical protein
MIATNPDWAVIQIMFIMTIVCNSTKARVVYGAVVSQAAGGVRVNWIKEGVG